VELAFAKLWYSNSLVYEDIYVSDAEGVGGRPFTIALPLKKRWIVVLNLGPKGFNDPVASNKATLIHELAHAWQSQHHPDPWQFMVNSMQCRRAAAIGTVWAATQWRYFHEAGQQSWIKRNFFTDPRRLLTRGSRDGASANTGADKSRSRCKTFFSLQ
jgi:hypothetical protein